MENSLDVTTDSIEKGVDDWTFAELHEKMTALVLDKEHEIPLSTYFAALEGVGIDISDVLNNLTYSQEKDVYISLTNAKEEAKRGQQRGDN